MRRLRDIFHGRPLAACKAIARVVIDKSPLACQGRTFGSLTYAVSDLSRRDIEQYYHGFANLVLWANLSLSSRSRRSVGVQRRRLFPGERTIRPAAPQDAAPGRHHLGARLSFHSDGESSCASWAASTGSAFSCIFPGRGRKWPALCPLISESFARSGPMMSLVFRPRPMPIISATAS